MMRYLVVVFFLSVGLMDSPVQAAAPKTQQNTQTVTLAVGNLTCAMCKYTVENALKQVDGVQSAQVDMDKNTAVVIFDPAKTGVEKLVEAVTNAGYPATLKQ